VAILVGLTVAVGFILLVIPEAIFLVFFAVSVPDARDRPSKRLTTALVGGSSNDIPTTKSQGRGQ
jgi:hypothetical protein